MRRSASDPSQQGRLARAQERRQRAFIDTLRVLLDDPGGRLVLFEILDVTGLYVSVWDPSSKIHYFAGRQSVGLDLRLACLEASDAGFELMEREARTRAKRFTEPDDPPDDQEAPRS